MGTDMTGIVIENNVKKYEELYKSGYDKGYPDLDAVRLEQMFFESKPGILLDYGFGTGSTLIHFLKKGYFCYGLEASVAAIELVKNKLDMETFADEVKLDLILPEDNRLPYEENSLDYINCKSVLSLLGGKENIRTLLDEFKRVLKPSGKIIIDINGPESDMASKGKFVSEDTFEFFLRKGQTEPLVCYCPQSKTSFENLLSEFFDVVDMGVVKFEYFGLSNFEYLACAVNRL